MTVSSPLGQIIPDVVVGRSAGPVTLTHTGFTDILTGYLGTGAWRLSCYLSGSNLNQGDGRFRFGGDVTGTYTIRETASLASALGSSAIGTGYITVSFDASLITQPWVICGEVSIATPGTFRLQMQEAVNNATAYTVAGISVILTKVGN